MTYKIIGLQNLGDTINTLVEYNIDGVIITVEVANFSAFSQEEIGNNIKSRGLTEQKKLEISSNINLLIPQITLNTIVEF